MVRNPGRLLAPIAIIAVAVGAYLIVESNLGTHHPPAAHASVAPSRPARHHAVHTPARAPRLYTVRAGDTMSDIAARTHVPLARLEALNASLGPSYELHTGQRLRLRR